MQDEFKRIPLKDIEADPHQPRKHFDETALAELAHSISQYDVIEPIMVRPVKSKNGKYIIVVGERRFRAAGMAALPDIPAIIRKLTDGEALEVQITENLQRENVNPMEEAEAFKTILDSKRYKPKELAARIGKKVDYILQRVKLCELIPEFQELVYADKMKLTQAYLVCRFAKEVQQSYAGKIPKDWKEQPAGWKLSEIYFGNATHNLDEATFKTEDPKLNPKMGACGQCPFNSAVSQLQFEDFGNSRVCSNPSCYEIKQGADFKNKLQEVAADDSMLFIADWTYGDTAKQKIAAAEATGKPVLTDKQYQVLKAPTPPKEMPPFEDYVKANEFEEDATEEDKLNDYYYELKEYKEELEHYQQDLTEYEQKMAVAKKAYVVSSYNTEGKIIDVYVPTEDNTANLSVHKQIDELREKNKRAIERDKVDMLKGMQGYLTDLNAYNNREEQPELVEWMALFYLLFTRAGYVVREQILKEWGNVNMKPQQLLMEIRSTGRTSFMFLWMRRMLLTSLCTGNFEYDSENLSATNFLVSQLATRYVPGYAEEVKNEVKQKADTRLNKMNEKIAALQQTEIPAEV